MSAMKSTLLLCLLLPGMASSATLSTAPANNGSGGVYMDLTASGSESLLISGFDTYFNGIAGENVTVAVYIRNGSYAGFTGNAAGWTLWDTVDTTSAGTTTLAPITFGSALQIDAGETLAVYIHSTTSGQGIRYRGVAGGPPPTTWSDAYLTLHSEDAVSNSSTPFVGIPQDPRTFAGNIYYEIQGGTAVPEPTTFAMLGLGIAGLALWRRKAA